MHEQDFRASGPPDYETILRLATERRSVRRFRPDPVARELVEMVLDVARRAPSAANSQPWEFVVVEEAESRRAVARAAASLFAEGRKRDPTFSWSVSVQPFLGQAPVLIVVLGDRRMLEAYPSILRGNVLLRQSLANCVYGLQLAATSLGLATAWGTLQGGHPEDEIRELLGIPKEFTVDHIVPLGYPDDGEGARAAALEPARRRAHCRRPLDEVARWGHYDMSRARSDEAARDFIWSETVTRVRREAWR
jgi:5,6-dimethylbenzimidazole synthase